jgi:hypothetical protein
MATINEFDVWEPNIYELETTDPVLGGPTGIANRAHQQVTNRTRRLYNVLEENGIYPEETNHDFVGQNIDVTAVFEGTVSDGDLVYYHNTNNQYEKAIADGTEKAAFVGVADVTNGKVIAGGFLANPVITGVPAQGDFLFLSNTTAGEMTTASSAVPVGKYLWDTVIALNAGVGGGGAGQFDHEQDTYRMLLNSSWFLNGTWDNLFDVALLLDPGYTMTHDYGENKFDFTAGQLFETTNLYDPTLAITVDRAFLSVDIDDSGSTVFELTADGGANWEVAANNAVHNFSNTGTDLRLRVTGGGTGEVRSYGVLYNANVNLWNNMAAILHSAITDDEPAKHFAESAIRHSVIVDDEATKHRIINDGGTSTTQLWSSSKINSEIGAAVGPSSVGQAELKTSLQSQSQLIGTHSNHTFILTGGQYIFMPQYGHFGPQTSNLNVGFGDTQTLSTYVTTIRLGNNSGLGSNEARIRQRYVTASGEVMWLFILREIESGEFHGISFAPDHPCFGNGGDPAKVPHPYSLLENPENYEIFLVNPEKEDVAEWESDSRGLIDTIKEDYEIDELADPGMPDVPVTVGLPTDAENLPWGTPIEPIKIVIPTLADVIVTSLKLKS